MPNRETHIAVGIPVGVLVAGYQAKDQDPSKKFWEILGGGLGSYYGSRLPDIIEPALSPKHRRSFHSLVAGLSACAGERKLSNKWITWCRSKADYYRREQCKSTVSNAYKLLYFLIEIVLRILAGILSGLIYGYLSHVVLDAATPNSVPII
jgi:membrane-bound metal-dependent hydrolase YbcI (DUF457 family)